MKVTQNLSGLTDKTLIHEPRHVTQHPIMLLHLSPHRFTMYVAGKMKIR